MTIGTLSACISKYSAGSVYYYPSFHTVKNPGLVDKFDTDFRRYLNRKIGFESVMRIRCTRGKHLLICVESIVIRRLSEITFLFLFNSHWPYNV